MNIRTITAFLDWESINKKEFSDLEKFFEVATRSYTTAGCMLRTKRLCLSPITLAGDLHRDDIAPVVKFVSRQCQETDIRWFCVPLNAPGAMDLREVNDVALDIVKRYKNAFINYIVAQDGTISINGAHAAGKLIKLVSRLSNNGYDNFRVGASCNGSPNTPYFPFSYQADSRGFAIALELARPCMDIIRQNRGSGLDAKRSRIIQHLTPELQQVHEAALAVEAATGMTYHGIDISLAPYPDEANSVAAIVEELGVDAFGCAGTLFITSYLTDILRALIAQSGIRPAGFNGVMYSLLEDTRLGINSNYKEFSIDSLLSFASVCGCGIDMVPVPGNVFEEEIASILLDIAAMSSTLRKPLGVRVLPIPGKNENDFTDFNYDFLINSRVKGIRNKGCLHTLFDEPKPLGYLSPRGSGGHHAG